MEEWRDVNDFEDYYQVSSYGNVRRKTAVVTYSNGFNRTHKGKLIKPELTKGYLRVSLSKNGKVKRFLLHRLVAIIFNENKKNKPCVNHLDGNKLNNKTSNLEWCTYSENEKHSYNSLNKITNGIKCRKIDLSKLSDIKCMYANGFLQREIAVKYEVSNTTIQKILNGETYIKHL